MANQYPVYIPPSSTAPVCSSSGTGNISGTLTSTYIPVAIGPKTLGNSSIYLESNGGVDIVPTIEGDVFTTWNSNQSFYLMNQNSATSTIAINAAQTSIFPHVDNANAFALYQNSTNKNILNFDSVTPKLSILNNNGTTCFSVDSSGSSGAGTVTIGEGFQGSTLQVNNTSYGNTLTADGNADVVYTGNPGGGVNTRFRCYDTNAHNAFDINTSSTTVTIGGYGAGYVTNFLDSSGGIMFAVNGSSGNIATNILGATSLGTNGAGILIPVSGPKTYTASWTGTLTTVGPHIITNSRGGTVTNVNFTFAVTGVTDIYSGSSSRAISVPPNVTNYPYYTTSGGTKTVLYNYSAYYDPSSTNFSVSLWGTPWSSSFIFPQTMTGTVYLSWQEV